MTPAIRARNLTRRFGGVTAVDHLALEVPASRIYGFLGPNGSGKSTTIRMLCGLLLPSEGDVEILGYRVPGEAEAVKREIGYMTQQFSLYQELTVRENLLFLGEVYGIKRRETRQRLETVLATYQLLELRNQFAGTLSGGQRQRLALAAATLHRPRLLILDEPTSAVDPQSRRDFWDTLFELAEGGTTILVSTHYMDEAERCHRLAILDRGQLKAEGPPRELMRDLPAQVLELTTAEPQRVRAALERLTGIHSVAQLGERLHVLMDRDRPEPLTDIRRVLADAELEADVERVNANLEDVFVASTSRMGAGDGR